jgi:hypothetical protein
VRTLVGKPRERGRGEVGGVLRDAFYGENIKKMFLL